MVTAYGSTGPTSARGGESQRRVSWGAIFAGSVVALALMILFTMFGIGIGASLFDPEFEQNPASGFGIGSVLYLFVTQLISLGVGGYVAARLAGIPRPITSVLHGAAVWAVATIFMAWAAIMGGGALFGAASSVVTNTASAVAQAGQAIVPDDLSLPDPAQIASTFSIDSLPDEIQTTLEQNGVTEENIRQAAMAAFRDVFNQQEQQAAIEEARQTLGQILQSPGDAAEDISAFFDSLVQGPNAILSQQDLDQAMNVLQQRLGISQAEAQGVVQSIQNSVQTALDQAEDAVEAARREAVDAAQALSDAISTAALILSFVSLLGLAAACGGAFGGKPHSLVGARRSDHA